VAELGVSVDPIDRLVVQLPVNTIRRESAVQVHVAFFIVTAEYARETVLKGYDGAVKDAVGGGDQVAGDDGIQGIAPDYIGAA
jgi:hypothetical protein